MTVSNDALRESLRPAVSASSGGGILQALVRPAWRYAECWLLARAPWQRSALSLALGALLGLAIVAAVAPRFRADPASVAAESSGAILASTQSAAAASPVTAAAAHDAQPLVTTDELVLAQPPADSASDVASPLVKKPAPAPRVSKSKQRKRAHARRTPKPASARSLSQLFRELRRSASARGARWTPP